MNEFVSPQNRISGQGNESGSPLDDTLPTAWSYPEGGPQDLPGLNCEQFETRVQELLDRRLDPADDSAIERHVRSCAPCAKLLTDFQALELALRQSAASAGPQRSGSANSGRSRLIGQFDPAGAIRLDERLNRPQHPASREQQTRVIRYFQAAVLLIAVGLIGIGAVQQKAQRTALLPVPGAIARGAIGGAPGKFPGGFQPVASYRSLEQCYELTSELPGVRPLQASIWVALDWWQQYFGLSPSSQPDALLHERGFGLNPLVVESMYQA